MSRDDSIRIAKDAISDTINQHDQMLKRLWCIAYEAGQKAEREACAKLIELHGGDDRFGPAVTIERLVAAIRARKDKQ